MATDRLQKVLAHRGVASRRSCEELIKHGRVKVNGKAVTEMGVTVDPDIDDILVDGKPIAGAQKTVVVALNKPRGYVSTVSDPHAERTVMDIVKIEGHRLYPVGRLDKESRGLMLLTDDGDLANKLLHPSHRVEKIYEVTAKGGLDAKALERMAKGVMLEDGMTDPARLIEVRIDDDKTRFVIGLKQGRKRQVRRMVRAVGGHVTNLRRIEFAGLKLGDLPEGKWRELSRAEVTEIKKRISLEGKSGRGR